MELHLNDTVLVKLTPTGKAELLRQRAEFTAKFPQMGELNLRESPDGYSKWQLWQLMQTFGHLISAARELPFEATMRLAEGEEIL